MVISAIQTLLPSGSDENASQNLGPNLGRGGCVRKSVARYHGRDAMKKGSPAWLSTFGINRTCRAAM
jgi:hypothetical protein